MHDWFILWGASSQIYHHFIDGKVFTSGFGELCNERTRFLALHEIMFSTLLSWLHKWFYFNLYLEYPAQQVVYIILLTDSAPISLCTVFQCCEIMKAP